MIFSKWHNFFWRWLYYALLLPIKLNSRGQKVAQFQTYGIVF